MDHCKLWDDYAISFSLRLVAADQEGWLGLDEDEQEIAALWKLSADMYDGGFIQFFCNWGYYPYSFAMRGLERIGDHTLHRLLKSAFDRVLQKFEDDERITSYWEIPKYLSLEDEKVLDEADSAFNHSEGEKLAEMAYAFYCVTLNKE